MVRFVRGLLRLPIAVQTWLVVLGGVNMVVPLFYLDRLEARVTLMTITVASLLMGILTQKYGFTRILGAGHFVWFGLIPFLWTRLDAIPAADVYGYWIRAVVMPIPSHSYSTSRM